MYNEHEKIFKYILLYPCKGYRPTLVGKTPVICRK